jgi:arylsulfatase A-like enzyme
MMWLVLAACGTDRPKPVPTADAAFVRLEDLAFSKLEIPPSSRPTAEPPPQSIPLEGPWHEDARGERRGYTMPIPIRPRGLFFYRAEAGIRLLGPKGGVIPYESEGPPGKLAWTHDREQLTVWGTGSADPPAAGAYSLIYDPATAREAALNFAHSGISDAASFVWADIQDDWDARHGLLLPAPGIAEWAITVPPAGELSFVGGVVEPEIQDGPASDGATISVVVAAAGEEHVVGKVPVAPRAFEAQRFDLSRWAGQEVTLSIRTDPAGTPVFDYVFLAEPVVASRKADPVTVLLVFIDTLRADHMSLYGYHRDTTAAIDHLKDKAAVFEHAYTVAPWTLPSARSLITGRHPESYLTSETLPHMLGKRGFANAFFAGNVYLSTNFEMQRGWDLHRVGGIWPPGDETTDRALRWLDEHDGRDALLQVHYMDVHLPYHEPASYRSRYAGPAHPKLGEKFEVQAVRAANIADDPAAVQYIQDRYDNNIRFATDQVARLVERLDDNDILLIYADHGEEFWEHGRYEHGHSLFDELMHVPLVIDGPGVGGGKIDSPVSLIDLVPTVLELVGAPVPDGLDGRSLVPLLRGDAEAATEFRGRTLAFGRPLYGPEQWGALAKQQKWTTSEGREALYDLAQDPGEEHNLIAADPDDRGAPYRALLAEELDRPVPVGYRIVPSPWKGGNSTLPTWALCTVPGGFSEAWPGEDPLANSRADLRRPATPEELRALTAAYQVPYHTVEADAGGVEICWPTGFRNGREVYLIPARPLEDVAKDMRCSVYVGDANGGKRFTMTFPDRRTPAPGSFRVPLQKVLFDERSVVWQYGIGPVPRAGESIKGQDAEMKEMLEALGYVDRDGETGAAGPPEGERLESGEGCQAPIVPLAPIDPPGSPKGSPKPATP